MLETELQGQIQSMSNLNQANQSNLENSKINNVNQNKFVESRIIPPPLSELPISSRVSNDNYNDHVSELKYLRR